MKNFDGVHENIRVVSVETFSFLFTKSYYGAFFAHVVSIECKFTAIKDSVCIKRSSTPTGLIRNTNVAPVSLFWDTNMAAVTSCENTIVLVHQYGGRDVTVKTLYKKLQLLSIVFPLILKYFWMQTLMSPALTSTGRNLSETWQGCKRVFFYVEFFNVFTSLWCKHCWDTSSVLLFRGFSELETGRLLEAFESRFQAINQIHFEWI